VVGNREEETENNVAGKIPFVRRFGRQSWVGTAPEVKTGAGAAYGKWAG